MATRYIGNAKLAVTYDDRAGQYKVAISARGKHLSTQYVRPPNAHRGYGVDNPKAYDEAASAAASFEVHEGGPASDALESGYAMSGMGWNVKRTAARKNAARVRKASKRPTRKATRKSARKASRSNRPRKVARKVGARRKARAAGR